MRLYSLCLIESATDFSILGGIQDKRGFSLHFCCKSNKKNKNMQTFLCLIQFLFVNLQPQTSRGNLQIPLSQSFCNIKDCKASTK